MEKWKDVLGYEGLYQVSDKGRVRSIDHEAIGPYGARRIVLGRMKKPSLDRYGYLHVLLSKGNDKRTVYVHRLVANAFIPNPNNKPEVNHKDADKTNNEVDNLEWVTGEENRQHAIDNGIASRGKRVVMDDEVMFDSIKSCAKYIGVDPHEIRRALQGKYKTVHGHVFRLAE